MSNYDTEQDIVTEMARKMWNDIKPSSEIRNWCLIVEDSDGRFHHSLNTSEQLLLVGAIEASKNVLLEDYFKKTRRYY